VNCGKWQKSPVYGIIQTDIAKINMPVVGSSEKKEWSDERSFFLNTEK
jgi:hypothetical protein